MSRAWVIVALMLLSGAGTAFARLGENVAQCEVRYGPATLMPLTIASQIRQPDGTVADTDVTFVSTSDPNAMHIEGLSVYAFTKNGIKVKICFFKNKALFETFTGEDGRSLSAVQLETLLGVECAGMIWTPVESDAADGESAKYTRNDGATAYRMPPALGGGLTIISREWAAFTRQAIQQAKDKVSDGQRKQLEGF